MRCTYNVLNLKIEIFIIKVTTWATINNIFGIRTDSNNVYFKYFRQRFFSTENSPGIPLRVQSNNTKMTFFFSAQTCDFFYITKHFTCSTVNYCCPSSFLISFIFWLNPEGYPRWIFSRKKKVAESIFNIHRSNQFFCWFEICYWLRLKLWLLS